MKSINLPMAIKAYADNSGYISEEGIVAGEAYAVLPAKDWERVLALMDEAQEELSVSKDSAEFAKKSRGISLNIYGGEVDEPEQKPEWEPGMWFEHQGPHECKAVSDSGRLIRDERGYWHTATLCRHVPPAKEETPDCICGHPFCVHGISFQLGVKSCASGLNTDFPCDCKEYRAVETSENPFQGPHWDRINEGTGDHSKGLRDLRDELRRMRGGE